MAESRPRNAGREAPHIRLKPRPETSSRHLRQGFRTVAIGLALGFGAALAAARSLRGLLPGLASAQAAPMLLGAALVAVAAAVACWIPARRATRTDPIFALRQE